MSDTKALLLTAAFLPVLALAQTSSGIQNLPASEMTLSGNWTPLFHEDWAERTPGPEIADYLGLPINDAARKVGLSWDASRMSVEEHQCQVHVVPYIYRGPTLLYFWEERDPETQRVIAIKNYLSNYQQTRTIWMDGRPHPDAYAAHTWMGFSTGKWQGNVLTVYTTHIKQGFLRRNGLPESDRATLTEHFIRYGDNLLTHVSIVTDPVYLSEPLIKSQDFSSAPYTGISWTWPCEPVVEIRDRPKNLTPHHLPGKNPNALEFSKRHGIPEQVTLGGAEGTYPEYQLKLKQTPIPAPNRETPAATVPDSSDGEIHVLPVQGSVHLIAGAGGNVVVEVGPQGVLLVDSGRAAESDKVIAAVRKISDKPIRYILNTSVDAEHTGGNDSLRKAGMTIAGALFQSNELDVVPGANIVAHENVLNRMSGVLGRQALASAGAFPLDTYFGGTKRLYFNEGIAITHMPAAHTDGDSVVFFRHSDVIAAGDIFVTTGYPVIDVPKGGSIGGIIEGLNGILDLTIAKQEVEGGTYVIPGHGRISDQFDVLEYRDMMVIIRDRIQAMAKQGMTVEQVKAAHPTEGYDGRYGATTGPWTTDMFVEAVYKTLGKK